MKNFDKIFAKIALPVLVAAGILIIITIALSTEDTSKENNGYIRVINCVVSIPATVRTQTDIEKCYSTVEKDLGIRLQRYDTSSYRN